ncbi:MAG: aminopeptidase YwaD [Cyclobacteriaceae bacterium]
MKRILIIALIGACLSVSAQKVVKKINKEVKKMTYESHLRFLASDELRGRNTGTVENEIAARYIANQLQKFGVKPAPGQEDYFQGVRLVKSKSPATASMTVGEKTFELWDDMLFLTSDNVDIDAEVVYVDFGFAEDLVGKDLKGKIVISKAGNGNPKEGFYKFAMQKRELAQEAGAIAFMELYRPATYPWKLLINYLSGDRFVLDNDQEVSTAFPTAWILDADGEHLGLIKEMDGKSVNIKITGAGTQRMSVPNVVGYIEGTDPKLKEEYIMISAHLDHVGVKDVGGEADSIWNGARDNGIGTANLLTAAEYFSKNPTKRSIAFLACNAEEVGLLGSKWYVEHPLIPLEKTVYDLNTDTGGYNDITKVTVVGFNRTSVTQHFVDAAKAFGLEAIDDPLPEENYYDRSDNVSFAAKGIPSVSYDPGYVSMNEEITKYYHQPEDEPNSLNFDYLTEYSKSFIYAVTLIGNRTEPIFWTEGDKYEPAGKSLYGKE